MPLKCVWEHNRNDTLLYSVDHVGAFTRGESLDVAISKMNREILSYCIWSNKIAGELSAIEIVQEKTSDLNICDADSDVLFDLEKEPLSLEEYQNLKQLALKSAMDFYDLYSSIPDKTVTVLPERNTFYGNVPRTAQQMYDHTKSVNAYYFVRLELPRIMKVRFMIAENVGLKR